MSQNILIKNGHIIDPANGIDQISDLLVVDGKIQKIAEQITNTEIENLDSLQIIDAKDKVVSPGFIDIHVHLREPGREDKETIHTASRSAAKGGITSVVAMPNSDPVADDQTVLEYVLSKAKKESLINIFVSGTITKGLNGKEISEIWELQQTGAVVVTDDGSDVNDAGVYRKAIQYCKTHNMPMLSHTEDINLTGDGQIHEGKVSSLLGLQGIPPSSEDVATARIICLVDEIQHQMHFTHVSTTGSVHMIRDAQKRGLKITADVTPHHFSLTDEAVLGFNTNAKMKPPLRDETHRQSLLEGLQDGTISVIATDHAPHLWTEKHRSFEDAPFGIVGFETMLPLIITNLVRPGILSLKQALEKITINPSQILNLNKGTLSIGTLADITIFDPNQKQTIDITKFESKGANSPFHGETLYGVVTETIVNGKIIVQNSTIQE